MKNRLLAFVISKGFLLFTLLGSVFVYGQGDEIYRITDKKSPESSGSVNGNSSNVDMFRGNLNNSIPIYNYKGREFDLPITLGYLANGIKVNQLASNVGLGWNLNVGGRVTRMVVGNADDSMMDSSSNCPRFSQENPPVIDCYYRDYYKVDAPGYEDVFQFTSCPACVNSVMNYNRKITVSALGLSIGRDAEWIVESEDGTKFYFGQNDAREKTVTNSAGTGCALVNERSTSSWLLTKIVSKNKLDEYTFVYQNFEWAQAIPNNGEGGFDGYTKRLITSSYKVNQRMPVEIFHNGEKIISFTYENRDDLPFIGSNGNALASINLLNYKSSSFYKKINFTYSYFGNTASPDFLEKRLKLDDITFVGIDANNNQVAGDNYHFDYILPAEVPSIRSYGRDYLGLYNGNNSNVDLVNNNYTYDPYLSDGEFNPPNSNRSFKFEKAKIGTLEKITFPSKGSAVFEYEQNAESGGFGKHIPSIIPQSMISL